LRQYGSPTRPEFWVTSVLQRTVIRLVEERSKTARRSGVRREVAELLQIGVAQPADAWIVRADPEVELHEARDRSACWRTGAPPPCPPGRRPARVRRRSMRAGRCGPGSASRLRRRAAHEVNTQPRLQPEPADRGR